MKQALTRIVRMLRYGMRYSRVRNGLFAMAVGIVLVLVTAVYAWPAQRETGRLLIEIEKTRRTIANDVIARQLTKAATNAERELAHLEPRLHVQGAQLLLIKRFTELAKRLGMQIVGESYEEGKPKDGYTPLHHELNLQGNYSAMRQYLNELHKTPTLTLIQEASFNRSGTSGQVKVRLRLVTYRKSTGT